MAVEPQVVKTRIREIRDCVLELREVGEMPEAQFLSDRRTIRATERLLQVAIQSVLDVGSHLIAALGFREPEGYAEIIDVLGEERVIPEDFAGRIRGMAGLRNILVHEYIRVDPAKLRNALRTTDDFETFCRHVLDYLER